jgi:hypothetical protein
MNEINIDQLPKQFSENIIVGSNDQTFIFVVLVGSNAVAYALSPEHAKNVSKVLSTHIERFEKNVRTIREGTPSPLQRSELGPSGKNDSKK